MKTRLATNIDDLFNIGIICSITTYSDDSDLISGLILSC